MGDWRTGELVDWRNGKLEDWGLEDWGLEDWGTGGLEDWRTGVLWDWRTVGLEDCGTGGLGDCNTKKAKAKGAKPIIIKFEITDPPPNMGFLIANTFFQKKLKLKKQN